MKAPLFLLLVLLSSVVGTGQTISGNPQTSRSACSSPIEVQKPLVPILRVLNDAEVKFRGAHKRFAFLQELLDWDVTKQLAKEQGVQLGSAENVVTGYTFRLTVSEAPKQYSIVAWKTDPPCKYVGAVSDDRGLILLARALK
jgi:hypothetical protein